MRAEYASPIAKTSATIPSAEAARKCIRLLKRIRSFQSMQFSRLGALEVTHAERNALSPSSVPNPAIESERRENLHDSTREVGGETEPYMFDCGHGTLFHA